MSNNSDVILRDAKVPLDAISAFLERPFESEHGVIRRLQIPIASVADDERAVARGVGPAGACDAVGEGIG